MITVNTVTLSLKHNHSLFVQGGTPWVTQVLNKCLDGTLLCKGMFGVKNIKTIQNL